MVPGTAEMASCGNTLQIYITKKSFKKHQTIEHYGDGPAVRLMCDGKAFSKIEWTMLFLVENSFNNSWLF